MPRWAGGRPPVSCSSSGSSRLVAAWAIVGGLEARLGWGCRASWMCPRSRTIRPTRRSPRCSARSARAPPARRAPGLAAAAGLAYGGPPSRSSRARARPRHPCAPPVASPPWRRRTAGTASTAGGRGCRGCSCKPPRPRPPSKLCRQRRLPSLASWMATARARARKSRAAQRPGEGSAWTRLVSASGTWRAGSRSHSAPGRLAPRGSTTRTFAPSERGIP
mmetsp:Transcript_45725/g.103793  ORF Transcript_45725/g.103793 Transcript_45725/m.103793 type:complete len:220 (-) Transcript_45725:560-1219(-)